MLNSKEDGIILGLILLILLILIIVLQIAHNRNDGDYHWEQPICLETNRVYNFDSRNPIDTVCTRWYYP